MLAHLPTPHLLVDYQRLQADIERMQLAWRVAARGKVW